MLVVSLSRGGPAKAFFFPLPPGETPTSHGTLESRRAATEEQGADCVSCIPTWDDFNA